MSKWSIDKFKLQNDNIILPNFYNRELEQEINESNLILDYNLLLEESENVLKTLNIFFEKLQFLFNDVNSVNPTKDIKSHLQNLKRHFLFVNLNTNEYKMYPQFLIRKIFMMRFYFIKNYNLIGREDELDMIERILNEEYFKFYILDSNLNEYASQLNIISPLSEKCLEILETNLNSEKQIYKMNIENPEYIPSITNLIIFFKYIRIISTQIINNINILQNKKSINDRISFFRTLAKIKGINEILHHLYESSHNDFFDKSEVFLNLNNIFEKRIYFDKEKIYESIQKIDDKIKMAAASIYKIWDEKSNNFMNVSKSILQMGTYTILKKRQNEIISKLELNPKNETYLHLWNLIEQKLIVHLSKISFSRIKWCRKVYLKKTMKEINKEVINILNKKLNENFNLIVQEKKVDFYNAEYRNDLFYKSIENPEIKKEYVRVRLISPSRKKIPNLSGYHSFWGMFNFLTPSKILKYPNSLIIHIHGGGFVSLTSASHEVYTREFSKQLRVPLISIDYRLAPDNPFPNSLDDVFQVYMWIINHAETEFLMKINRIVLMGESSGGTLALSLVYLLIMLNKRLPDALILAYPGLSFTFKSEITPSFLNYFENDILPFNIIKFVIDAYRKDYNVTFDPFVSPLYMKDQILKLLPPVRIVFGSCDPHRDIMMKFVLKLNELNNNVKAIELKFFPHGFLTLLKVMPEAKIAVNLIMDMIEPFL